MTRHRQLQFPSPFDPDSIEFDPERELWVPGRKKIFLPTVKPASLWDFFDREMIEKFKREDLFQGQILRGWDMVCECVPGRSSLMVPRNLEVPFKGGIYAPGLGDVKRTTEPQFKSRRMIDRELSNYRRW